MWIAGPCKHDQQGTTRCLRNRNLKTFIEKDERRPNTDKRLFSTTATWSSRRGNEGSIVEAGATSALNSAGKSRLSTKTIGWGCRFCASCNAVRQPGHRSGVKTARYIQRGRLAEPVALGGGKLCTLSSPGEGGLTPRSLSLREKNEHTASCP